MFPFKFAELARTVS